MNRYVQKTLKNITLGNNFKAFLENFIIYDIQKPLRLNALDKF